MDASFSAPWNAKTQVDARSARDQHWIGNDLYASREMAKLGYLYLTRWAMERSPNCFPGMGSYLTAATHWDSNQRRHCGLRILLVAVP